MILSILAAMGVMPVPRIEPAVEGVYSFGGVITDNATTEVNLTSAAACNSRELQNIGFNGDQPQIQGYITSFSVMLHSTNETKDNLDLVLRYLELHHKRVADSTERYISCEPCTSFGSDNEGIAAVDSDEATLTTVSAPGRSRPVYVLERPLQVDFNVDTFGVSPETAINLGADLPFTVILHGVFWPSSQGKVPKAGCGNEKTAAKFLAANVQRLRSIRQRLG